MDSVGRGEIERVERRRRVGDLSSETLGLHLIMPDIHCTDS